MELGRRITFCGTNDINAVYGTNHDPINLFVLRTTGVFG